MATNCFGLDTGYIKKNLEQLLRDIDRYTPAEMARALDRLADVARPGATSNHEGCMSNDTIDAPKQLLVDLVALWDNDASGPRGSPNHSHDIPGQWDGDNGALAGQSCDECALYDEVRRLVADSGRV